MTTSTIAYDPSLVLGMIVDPNKTTGLKTIAIGLTQSGENL